MFVFGFLVQRITVSVFDIKPEFIPNVLSCMSVGSLCSFIARPSGDCILRTCKIAFSL